MLGKQYDSVRSQDVLDLGTELIGRVNTRLMMSLVKEEDVQ